MSTSRRREADKRQRSVFRAKATALLLADGVDVVNTPAYLVQLYHQDRLSVEKVLGDFARLARRSTLKPECLQAALKRVSDCIREDPELYKLAVNASERV